MTQWITAPHVTLGTLLGIDVRQRSVRVTLIDEAKLPMRSM